MSATKVLSESQLDLLFKEAEERLRSKSGQLIEVENDNEIRLDAGSGMPQKRKPIPKLQHNLGPAPYIKEQHGVVQTNPEAVVDKEQRKLADQLRKVESVEKSKTTNDQLSAGPEWFDLPKTDLTPQLRRDLKIIELRSVLDPHRHYKKNVRKGQIPQFSQVGTVIEGPTEWFSSRINKKDRAKNFVEEALNSEQRSGRFKRKYNEIQDAKKSGKTAHYKKLMSKRRKGA